MDDCSVRILLCAVPPAPAPRPAFLFLLLPLLALARSFLSFTLPICFIYLSSFHTLGLQIDSEKYFAILMDRAYGGPVMVASKEGGMDIEEVAESNPDAIVTEAVDIFSGTSDPVVLLSLFLHSIYPLSLSLSLSLSLFVFFLIFFFFSFFFLIFLSICISVFLSFSPPLFLPLFFSFFLCSTPISPYNTTTLTSHIS